MLKENLQKMHAKYSVAKFDNKNKAKEAFVILRHVASTGKWPHGDEEYDKILAEANLRNVNEEAAETENADNPVEISRVSKDKKIVPHKLGKEQL